MKLPVVLIVLAILVVSFGCRKGMVEQAHVKPMAEEEFFHNGSGARPIPEHTVARGHLNEDDGFFRGMNGDRLVTAIPMPVKKIHATSQE